MSAVCEMLAVLSAKKDSLHKLDTSLNGKEAETELAEEYKDLIIRMKTQGHLLLRTHKIETGISHNSLSAWRRDGSTNSIGS